MKKQILSRISFALVICALFGMTGCGNFPQTIPDTTSDEPTTTEPTTTEPTTTEPTWKSIEYTPEKEFVDYDYGKESKATKKVTVTALIPDTWVSGSEIENERSYIEWNSESLLYMRRLDFSALYRITDIELFNETACSESVSTSTLESIDNFKIESGETEQGYAYIMFTKRVEDNFRSIIYLKASDEYVFSFEYSGESDLMYEYAVKSLNSIKVNVA